MPLAARSCAVLITCEHASASVPRAYRHLFDGHLPILRTHRASDLGASTIAEAFGQHFKAAVFSGNVTRLLVDLNRAPRSAAVFSEFTRPLPDGEKQALLATFHAPHRAAVEAQLRRLLEPGVVVVHLAIHSFTPVLHGETRNADIGLLYDPRRSGEKALCGAWKKTLEALAPALRVRRNYPYRGIADGMATHLRRRYQPERYVGIELEVNQACLKTKQQQQALAETLVTSAASALSHWLDAVDGAACSTS